MRSIIQEESSVEKAIRKSWEKAGKPTEFTIKVFEEEKKNFLGMTKEPAKIAIFFEDKPQKQKTYKKQYYRKKQPQRQQASNTGRPGDHRERGQTRDKQARPYKPRRKFQGPKIKQNNAPSLRPQKTEQDKD